MPRLCLKCEEEIPKKRLEAVPDTNLCRLCKAKSDEPRLTSRSPILSKSLVESSLSDLGEMSKEARELTSSE